MRDLSFSVEFNRLILKKIYLKIQFILLIHFYRTNDIFKSIRNLFIYFFLLINYFFDQNLLDLLVLFRILLNICNSLWNTYGVVWIVKWNFNPHNLYRNCRDLCKNCFSESHIFSLYICPSLTTDKKETNIIQLP